MLVETTQWQLRRWAAITRARTIVAARRILHAESTGLSRQEGVWYARRFRNEGNIDASSTSNIGLAHGRPHVTKVIVSRHGGSEAFRRIKVGGEVFDGQGRICGGR